MNPSFMWNPPAPANRSGAGSFQDHSTPGRLAGLNFFGVDVHADVVERFVWVS